MVSSFPVRGLSQVKPIYFGGKKVSIMLKRYLLLGRKAMTNLDFILKKQRHHFADKGPYSQSYGFSSNHVWMGELRHKEG